MKSPKVRMDSSVPRPNPLLDGVLVSLFFSHIVLVVYTLKNEKEDNILWTFIGLLGMVGLVVFLTKSFFGAVGSYVSQHYLKNQGHPLRKKVTMKKWRDQSWQLVIHVSMALFEYYILSDETWWDDTSTVWQPHPTLQTHKYSLRLLYITQMAIWIYTGFSCKFLEEVRKDYLVMMTHHVVTISLMYWSYYMGHLRIGAIVLFLHDVSDIPLDVLKMVNYLKLEGFKGFFLTELCFVSVFVTWCYWRIYLYPVKILYCSGIQLRQSVLPPDQVYRILSNLAPEKFPLYALFNILLSILYMLHIWWFFLILRLVVGILTKGSHQAGKDEYEGASSESESETKDD